MNKKLKILRGRIGITEKSHETRRDCWDGNVNQNPYFDSFQNDRACN